MKHKYKIGYSSEEESHFFEFENRLRYSSDELKHIVDSCVMIACQKILSKRHKNDWQYNMSFEEIIETKFFKKEMRIRGFKRVRNKWWCFWRKIDDTRQT